VIPKDRDTGRQQFDQEEAGADMPLMDGKTVLVTGGTGGVGKATALHPDVVRTAFGAEDQATYFRLLIPLMWPFMKTAAQGAATSIYLASSAEVEGVTGQYFANASPGSPASPRTTPPRPAACGRSAPTSSASRPRPYANQLSRAAERERWMPGE